MLVILKEIANQEGLSEEQISRLVHIATSKKYSKYSYSDSIIELQSSPDWTLHVWVPKERRNVINCYI